MIAEATQVTFLRGIDEFTLRERHKVEMLDPLLVVLDHTFPKYRLPNNLPNVLVDEIVSFKISVSA